MARDEHDPEETIAFALREQAKQAEEIRRLNRENAALRTLLVELLRTVKEVEINLQRALDKDGSEDYLEDRRHV